MSVVIGAVAIASATLLTLAYFGLLFRDNPREAPTWTVVGIIAGVLGIAGAAIALWVAKLIRAI
jgi:multisubunit Na+/H+ antiporter MnhB subunit